MAHYVDLNADVGEEFTDDAGLLSVVTSANVACGAHAGSSVIMRAVCAEAVRRGITLGALVSYVDRPNAGMVLRDVDSDRLTQQVADQIGTLAEAARVEGGFVTYLKVHGALYHRSAADGEHAAAVLAGSGSLPVLGTPGSLLLTLASDAGRPIRHEGFPDRLYTNEGALVPRDQPGAVLEESSQIARQALELAPVMDSLSVQGHTPDAVGHARAVRAHLAENHWTLRTCWLSTAASK